jgi:excisionase family DNA binding protein
MSHVHKQTIKIAQTSTVNEWLTVNAAAAYLSISRATLYRWMETGVIPYAVVGPAGRRRLRRDDLDAAMTRATESLRGTGKR